MSEQHTHTQTHTQTSRQCALGCLQQQQWDRDLTHRLSLLSFDFFYSDGGANEVLLEVVGKGLGFKPQRMHAQRSKL